MSENLYPLNQLAHAPKDRSGLPIVDESFAVSLAFMWNYQIPVALASLINHLIADDSRYTFLAMVQYSSDLIVLPCERYNACSQIVSGPDGIKTIVTGFEQTHLAVPILYSETEGMGLVLELVSQEQADEQDIAPGIYATGVSAPVIAVHYQLLQLWDNDVFSEPDMPEPEVFAQTARQVLVPDIPSVRPGLWKGKGKPKPPWTVANRPKGYVINHDPERSLVMSLEEIPEALPFLIESVLKKSK